ncbi:hypothetical protein C475_14508 [Halosimplex carlsbadense 2-9-1]|uniref:Uncharacterized protein n=1 Tax=Halosimplex carlsbadense 2-9-1 TaxID=797114 RepID=M0CLK6_9EURY|nr:hypothetical protein [Halosimplex carlsbadense]ELZ23493.1 hypothetical protein C475_14508 [Halosimplex carlsbadense 2-9-1]
MLSNLPLEVDDARLSDLGFGGWFGLVIIGAGAAIAGSEIVDWATGSGSDVLLGVGLGAVVALVGAMFAYEDASPECDATCANCGAHVRAHSSRDSVDEYVEVNASGAPRRATLGPLSVVIGTHEHESIYCSGECAAKDDRVLLERDGEQLEPVATSDAHREGEVA